MTEIICKRRCKSSVLRNGEFMCIKKEITMASEGCDSYEKRNDYQSQINSKIYRCPFCLKELSDFKLRFNSGCPFCKKLITKKDYTARFVKGDIYGR